MDEPVVTQTTGQEWRAGLPEDIRGEKSFDVFKGKDWGEVAPVMAKSFLESQRMIGGRIPIPSKPEEVEAFKKEHLPKLYQAGVLEATPETPDKYGLTKPDLLDDGMFKGFIEHAHKAGMPPSMVKASVDYYAGIVKQITDDQLKTHNESVEALKKEYGVNYDQNVAIAQRAVAAYASDSLKKKLDTYGLGDDPDMVKMWVEIARLKGEDKIIKGQPSQSAGTKEGALVRIEALKKDQEWQKARMNGDAVKIEEWNTLFKTAYGS